jgi:hypothetical protein
VIVGCQRLAAVHDRDDQVCDASGLTSPRDAFVFDDVQRLAGTGSINERDRDPVDVNRLGDQIACRTRHARHDRAIDPGQRVEQTRFPDVGTAHQYDNRPFSHEAAPACVGKQ